VRGFPNRDCSDSSDAPAMEAGRHGSFGRSSGTVGCCGERWAVASRRWRAIWGERGERGSLDAAGSQTGSFAAKPSGGDTRSDRIERQADFILATVAETSDITLAELRGKLIEERGETFGVTTIWRFFQRRKITLKKSPPTQPSKSARTS